MKFSENRSDQIGLAIIATLIVLIVFLLANIGWSDNSDDYPPVITVSGEGTAFAVADTAVFTYTARAEAETAAEAQAKVSETTAAVVAALQAQGVEERDIKTQNYNVFPRYEYRQVAPVTAESGGGIEPSFYPGNETRVLVGYEATQTDQVRVRQADTAGSLLSLATDNGAADVSSLDFVVWDETEVEAEARSLAITDAKQKANQLADQLGVRLGDIRDFYENGNEYYEPYPMDARMEMSAAKDEGGASAPANISLGENEVRKNVSITFEIK